MAINHAAQKARIDAAMSSSGYEINYHDGGSLAQSAPHEAFGSNSHKLNAAREAEKVSNAVGDMSGKRIDYAGGIRRV